MTRPLVEQSAKDADRFQQTEDWETLCWKKLERNVYRLQKRIFQARRRGDLRQVHNLQKLLLRSYSARCLAVRQVTQDNQGKKTAGVDGVKEASPRLRLVFVQALRHLKNYQPPPVRRTYIPKNKTEKRPLGIPTLFDRSVQALVKLALEPEWEALFEPNSYGFRPGRSAHDAIEAIFTAICRCPKYVLDADIEKCFDRIAHEALLAKLNAMGAIQRLVRAWLCAGVMEAGKHLFPPAGTPQGGVISPLLANIALHGLEEAIGKAAPKGVKVTVVRYADDFVILCVSLPVLLEIRQVVEQWLADIGLQLKASKTHISHTLTPHDGRVGFDFLGFTVKQHRIGKYQTRRYTGQEGCKTLIRPSQSGRAKHGERLGEQLTRQVASGQAAVIHSLNPQIKGWANYYRTVSAKRIYNQMDYRLHRQLSGWAKQRHPRRGYHWCYRRYWHRIEKRMRFAVRNCYLRTYAETRIRRHVKVRGRQSPFDGDWLYWATRLGREPTKPQRITRLLKRQKGRCEVCTALFMTGDLMEVHHKDGNRSHNAYTNLALLHRHCHDQLHSRITLDTGIRDKDCFTEEPDAGKLACPVL